MQSRGDARVFVAALLAGCAFDVAAHNGFVTVAGFALVLTTVAGLLVTGRLRSTTSQVLAAVAGLLASALVVRSSPWVIVPMVGAIAVVLVLASSLARARSVGATFPVLGGRIAVAVGQILLGFGMVRAERRHDPTVTRARATAFARGVALALPVVIVIGALLGAADPVFRSWFDPPRLLLNVALILVGAWGLLGLCRSASSSHPVPKLASPPQLGTVEVVSVLGALCALYATFVAAQLVALTGGAEHVLTTSGLTYAEYARSGFFQLLAAAGLTLVILLSVRACADRRRLSVLAVSEATIALTLCVVVIAIRRLDLYETAYGLTMLRLASTVTAVWIGIVFLLLAVVVANRRSVGRWFAPAVVASAVLFVGIWAAANPAAIVTETNVRRATHGAPFDVGQAVSLGPDAVPALVRGLDDLPPPDAQLVRRSLCQSMADDEGRAYNRSTSDADAALEPICSAR